MLSDEEVNNILAEMEKYQKEERYQSQVSKKQGQKKRRDAGKARSVGELRRQIHAEMLKKLAFEEDHRRK